MATEAQKRARQEFVNRFAYGFGRAVAHAKHEGRKKTTFRGGTLSKKGSSDSLQKTRATIAFFVGLGKGISMRKKQQMENAKRRLARGKGS